MSFLQSTITNFSLEQTKAILYSIAVHEKTPVTLLGMAAGSFIAWSYKYRMQIKREPLDKNMEFKGGLLGGLVGFAFGYLGMAVLSGFAAYEAFRQYREDFREYEKLLNAPILLVENNEAN